MQSIIKPLCLLPDVADIVEDVVQIIRGAWHANEELIFIVTPVLRLHNLVSESLLENDDKILLLNLHFH